MDAAAEWAAAGYSVIPVAADGTKAPLGSWKRWQAERAGADQLRRWYGRDSQLGIGVVCGAVSGQLEMLELEGVAVADGLQQHLADVAGASGLGDLLGRITSGYLEQTPSGGLHWLVRLASGGEVAGNTKLARRPGPEVDGRPTVTVLAETRGEGGYVIVAPTGGTVHPTGRAWTRLAGSPATVATVSVDELEALHALFASLDEMPAAPAPSRFEQPAASGRDYEGGISPGDDWAARTGWPEILGPAGWAEVMTRGDITYWRRPGKRMGVSATTNALGTDRLRVFTTSTEFEAESYSKFGAYTVLQHGGDHQAAAKALQRKGFGQQPPERRLTLVHSTPATPAPAAADPGNAVPAPAATVTSALVSLTDDGNAQLLVAQHGERIRYVPQRGRWLVWDGHRWAWDDLDQVIQLARTTIRSIEPGDSKAIAEHRLRSLYRRGIESMVALSRSDPAVAVSAARLDADPWALCTPGGVIDLRTGELSPPDPAQLHTRSTRVTPDKDMATPRWDRFLEDTFGEDHDLVGFVRRIAGYSASGAVTHHVLPFLHGPGGNGKSVFLDVMRSLLGDYAATAPAGFLMAGIHQHETEVARLAGLRFVVCSEVNQEDRFDEAKVKLLTGGDALTARFMRQDHFTFEPTHHLWLMGNHQPAVRSGGESFWRRLRLIPFTRTVPPEKKVDGLDKILVNEEGPGILAWIIRGAKELQSTGMAEPSSVMAATQVYAAEEDALSRFAEDCLLIGGGALVRTATADLRRAYSAWCVSEGVPELSPQVLGRELRTRFGLEQGRSNGRRYYTGVSLLRRDEEGEDE